jgi:polyisoprenoid-binding protein YceI
LIVDRHEENRIEFFAEATLNNFEGITNSVEGFLKLSKKNNFDFKVDLDSIDTGIGLRNKHLREDLNTGKFPVAEFKGDSVILDSISATEYNIRAVGSFSVNGISRSLTAEGKFYNFGVLKKIESNLELKLSDFNIERPSFLFNKVHDLIKIKIIIYLKDQKR